MPENWTRVTLGDVVKLSGERTTDPLQRGLTRYVGLEHLDPGDLEIRRWGDVAEGTTFTSVFRRGHVLFGKRRAYQRKVGQAAFDGVCSSDIYVLEPSGTQLDPRLLAFICQSNAFLNHAVMTSAGSLSPRTNWKSLAEWQFDLPPREAQTQYVLQLEALESTRQSLRAVATACESLVGTLRAGLLSGRDEAVEMVCGVGSEPARWRNSLLGDLCTLRGGHGFRPEDWSSHGRPIIRIQNVRGGGEFNYFAGTPEPEWVVEPGELLFAWAGVPGVSFGPGIWAGPQAVLNQHIFRVTPQPGVDRDWLFEVLLHVTPGIEARAHGFKQSLLHITKADFQGIPVQVPSLGEQEEIANALATARAAGSLAVERARLASDLTSRLLQDLFGG